MSDSISSTYYSFTLYVYSLTPPAPPPTPTPTTNVMATFASTIPDYTLPVGSSIQIILPAINDPENQPCGIVAISNPSWAVFNTDRFDVSPPSGTFGTYNVHIELYDNGLTTEHYFNIIVTTN